MDSDGIPLTVCLTSGSDNEQTTAIFLEKKLTAMLKGKKLSATLKMAVFNDADYRILSSDQNVSIADLKALDKNECENKGLYNDKAYKIINADKAMDLGFYEKNDGYYAVTTNLDYSAKEIIAVSSKRYKIEDCFRVMKTNFGARYLIIPGKESPHIL